MKSRTKLITLAVLIPVLIGVTYVIYRIDTNIECWEDSVQSPPQICSESDYLAMATLLRVRTIADINYLYLGDSVKRRVVEAVYKTVSCAKGCSDSVAVWDIVLSSDIEDWRSRTGETTFVYGVRIPVADSISIMVSQDPRWESLSAALRNSVELRQAFEESGEKMPVIFFPDDGKVFRYYNFGRRLYYYDTKRTARSASPRTYWREVVKYLDSSR
jgi:hypothetical protein